MIGKTISHYKLLEKIGEGGLGVVYKAEDTRLHRLVAIKFPPSELTQDTDSNERFIQEARSASAIDHRNICTIHEIGESDDSRMFIVMAYYEGDTLKQRISQKSINLYEAIEISIQMAQGLQKVHENNIIHRDIKPANIIITPDGE